MIMFVLNVVAATKRVFVKTKITKTTTTKNKQIYAPLIKHWKPLRPVEILDEVYGYTGEYVGMLVGDILIRWFKSMAGNQIRVQFCKLIKCDL